jgi:DNA repair protein RadC
MKTYRKILTVSEKDENFQSIQIKSSHDAYNYVLNFYHQDIELYESFFILLLNKANRTIGFAKISQGGQAGTVVDIQIILKYMIDTLSTGIIIIHNHPSGNTLPSKADKNLTQKIKEAVKLFDCSLLDHLIITPENNYLSFADEGII